MEIIKVSAAMNQLNKGDWGSRLAGGRSVLDNNMFCVFTPRSNNDALLENHEVSHEDLAW